MALRGAPESVEESGSGQGGQALRINCVLPRAGLSGGIKSTRLLAEAMGRRGHCVTITFLGPRTKWPPPWRVRRFGKRLIRAWQLRGKQAHHLECSTVNLVQVRGDRIQARDVPDADVTIATWWETVEWITDWPSSKGAKVYFVRHYEVHGGDPERVRATYRQPVLKVVISTWLQKLMAEEFGDPYAVLVPNGVDWSQFVSVPRGKAAVPTVGVMYSPRAYKSVGTAFEAIRIAQRSAPSLRVISFGAEPVAAAYVVPENLEFFLRPAQQHLAALYRRCDCWLISATAEGFGMPGLEAAACRCPVVSTRCGGPEDYVRDGESGFLVNVGDAAEMAQRILDVVQQPEERWQQMSEASYSISRSFDWDRSAAKLERALRSYLRGEDGC